MKNFNVGIKKTCVYLCSIMLVLVGCVFVSFNSAFADDGATKSTEVTVVNNFQTEQLEQEQVVSNDATSSSMPKTGDALAALFVSLGIASLTSVSLLSLTRKGGSADECMQEV